jgi:copper ion binding protein
MARATLRVAGMTCQHCVRSVREALEGHQGVRSAEVDLENGRAVVEYDEGLVSVQDMAGVVAEEGYEAEEVA